MITRKRARIGSKCETKTIGCALEVETSEVIEATDDLQTFIDEQFSPESEESPGLDPDDFFNVDNFNWQLDKETLSSLFDLDESELPDLSSPASKGSNGDPFPRMGRVDGVRSLTSQEGGAAQTEEFKNAIPGRINKNAIAARLNRLKKKEYVNGLENKVTSLASENRNLRQENEHLNKRVEELEDETRYLRAVLANESMLAQLLSRLSGVNGMKLSTSLFQEPDRNDHDYALPRKRVKVEERETSGGVCLHVDRNHVSVEFCTKCAESANTALKM